MTISKEKRQKVFDLDGNKCLECGATDELTIDHIYPKSLGGTDRISNLQTLCGPCNKRKAARIKAGHSRSLFFKYIADREKYMEEIISSSPVNYEAVKVTLQNNCIEHFYMNRHSLKDQEAVLRKRIAHLKEKIGIRNARHWKSIRYRINNHQQVVQWRDLRTRETFEELINLCDSHRRISDELEKYRKALREHGANNTWTDEQRQQYAANGTRP